jgi:hypothetical protein
LIGDRAFRILETSAIDGNWVEESQYNRTGGKGVLVGNWQEGRTIPKEVPPKILEGPIHLSSETINHKRSISHAQVSVGLDPYLYRLERTISKTTRA